MAAGVLAARHLMELGHRRIAFAGAVRGERCRPFYRRRMAGVVEAMLEAGLTPDPALIWNVDEPDTDEMGSHLTRGDGSPTAVVAASWTVATALASAAREAGIDVPGQLSTVAFDNLPPCEYADPPLTRLAAPPKRLGRVGLHRLAEQVEHPDLPPGTTVVPVELIEGRSTAPPQAFPKSPQSP